MTGGVPAVLGEDINQPCAYPGQWAVPTPATTSVCLNRPTGMANARQQHRRRS